MPRSQGAFAQWGGGDVGDTRFWCKLRVNFAGFFSFLTRGSGAKGSGAVGVFTLLRTPTGCNLCNLPRGRTGVSAGKGSGGPGGWPRRGPGGLRSRRAASAGGLVQEVVAGGLVHIADPAPG